MCKGDIILTIDGQPFLEHPDLLLARRDPTLPLTLTVRNIEEPEDAAPRSVTLTPVTLADAPEHFTQPPVLGLNFRLRDSATQTATDSAAAYNLEWVVPGSPAALAGMKPGDQIITVNGQPFTSIKTLTQREQPEAPVTLIFQPVDGGASRTLTLTPAVPPSVGIAISPYINGHMQWMAERGVLAQLNSDAMSVVRVLKALTVPKSEGEAKRAASGLGGPIMIFSIFVQVIQNGLWVCLGFLRLICVNLALLNLLPIPVLDGGHILFALYAIVRRKEPSARFFHLPRFHASYFLRRSAMTLRTQTRPIHVGPVQVGGGAPVSVQTMANVPTTDVPAVLAQIRRADDLGCDIFRVAVPDQAAAAALPTLVAQSPLPLVADIHFDYRLALIAIDAGVAALRINPGNIGGPDRYRRERRFS